MPEVVVVKRNKSDLTKKEYEIFKLITQGYCNKDVARLLNISVRTVETHRLNARKKYGLGRLRDIVSFIKTYEDKYGISVEVVNQTEKTKQSEKDENKIIDWAREILARRWLKDAERKLQTSTHTPLALPPPRYSNACLDKARVRV